MKTTLVILNVIYLNEYIIVSLSLNLIMHTKFVNQLKYLIHAFMLILYWHLRVFNSG